MTLQERLADAHRRATSLYLHRQKLEQQRQTIQIQIAQCEQAMLKTDGEVEVLDAMIADEPKDTTKAKHGK